ncbi:hypothetical protein KA529_00665 [Candidatus Saccharibacteria bacterium]|nr:hypothetical protein [Candidatus Saccharibacteria bacterium]
MTEPDDNKEQAEDNTSDIRDIERQEAQLAARKAELQKRQAENIPQNQPTEPDKVKGGVLVLQWLTYAFAGWAILAIAALLVNVLWYYVVDKSQGAVDFSPYAIATVFVLLPILFICNSFYRKHDGHDKSGASNAIMLIHAVIFALCGIGALIVSVFSAVMLITSNQESKELLVAITTGIVMAFIYLLTFIRTINPVRLKLITKAFPVVLVILPTILLVVASFGPVARLSSSKEDQLIADNIGELNDYIQEYAQDKAKLPKSLSVLEVSQSDDLVKKLIENDLVEYKPNTKPAHSEDYLSGRSSTKQTYSTKLNQEKVHYYELCVDYKYEKGDDYNRKQEYETSYINAYSHPAGKVCYKQTTGYDGSSRYDALQ